ncbi:MAG TPA: DUF455 domain-containing protein [Gammaproteobacteria bacterium]|jgi:uncharacterized ferritin-like protein (DUF455 family)|nr:ferritin-like domain-containing protein [Pseudomonadota bacterium]HAY45965.1 DUF455 domain-containing protein [Gammaproteobacteria bacterium]
MIASADNLHQLAYKVLTADTVKLKCTLSQTTKRAWRENETFLDKTFKPSRLVNPGRPTRPQLVHPRELKRRGLGTEHGRLSLMHAVAHIEFNAINLAWDAVYRFTGQPKQYYDDWVNVAGDETRHFELVCGYLNAHNLNYGDLPAHNGLWDMAVHTDHDILVRMALVPRVMEARGLDVSPPMIEGLTRCGDKEPAKILELIYQEEIEHVSIGSKWYQYFCQKRDLPADSTFRELIKQYMHGELRGPFNKEGRIKAGFSQDELKLLLPK